MALYTRESVERVKDAVDMLELVGARTDLRRVGARWTGLCPFHEERTPSFSVNAEHKLYHCFGCGESGDAIRFVQVTEGLDFPAALELLADRYGVELEREHEDPEAERRRRRRERLLSLLARAADYYARYLWESAEAARARDYLEGRGLGEEVLRAFRVGFSPGAWDRVVSAALADGFTREEVLAADLGRSGRGGAVYDRFRERIMFPLVDARGRVLGFGARSLADGQGAKYINSAESELYHKRRQLFGVDIARPSAAKHGRIVVVEGYTDVLALHQAGVTESVAIMGTALTQEQLGELSRLASTVVLALDADRSGQEAMLRASRSAGERGVDLRVVQMPEGTDPAELLASEGAEAFEALLASAVSVPEFQVRRLLADADLHTPGGRDRALEEVRPVIASIPENTATRDAVIRQTADKLDVPVAWILSGLADAPGAGRDDGRGPAAAGPARRTAASSLLDAQARAEQAFLAMCLAQGELGRSYLERIDDEHLTSDAMRRARDHIRRNFDDPLGGLPTDDSVVSAIVTGVAMLAEEEPSSEHALRLQFLRLELGRVERELRHAQAEHDYERQQRLASARNELREQMAHVMGEAE
ncbi:MAG: DNA primase [Thermoleophilaceae bacterium]|nr:DNA primase [Thermoleophilaceae bacterium]